MAKNRQTEKTERHIKEAFLAMLETMPAECIRVSALTRACDIDRTTFYLHFSDVYGLLEAVENDMLEEAETLGNRMISENAEEDRVLAEIFSFIEKHRTVLRAVLSRGGSAATVSSLNGLLQRIFYEQTLKNYGLPEGVAEETLRHAVAFLSCGYYSVYRKVIAGSAREDVMEETRTANAITKAYLGTLLDREKVQ